MRKSKVVDGYSLRSAYDEIRSLSKLAHACDLKHVAGKMFVPRFLIESVRPLPEPSRCTFFEIRPSVIVVSMEYIL
jgi:hypothetical protein